MDVVRAHEASSSTARCTYQVFLSFRGKDTRRTFTGHLYTALMQAGLHTFRDDDEIERGEKIKSELEKGLQQSRASIIVFSKDYASSKWCLNELLMILEHRSSYGRVVLPVFYDVEPSDVRKQLGSIGESFARYEEQITSETDAERKKELMDMVKRWRGALKEAADLSGMELKNQANGDESNFIQKVVNVIQDKLSRKGLGGGPYLVGIHSRTNNINLWLQDGSTNVGLMVICGMGGIGKTTIAKFVFNQNFENFACSSFLENVKERSKEPKGLIHLQKQFLSDICKRKNAKIHDINEGINKIIDAICCKRILLVLDDVDQVDQLKALFSMRDRFCPGSKIIVTTRYERLLKPYEVHEVCKVEELGNDDSIKLFSLYAFGQDHPTEKYTEHTKKIVAYCGGLPLALQVLGSFLFGKNVGVWVSQLKKLETIADSHIVEKLKISFDSLQDDDVKNIFLHIACLFDGIDKDCTINILDACGMHTIVGIEHLIDRSLLAIDRANKLKMHQLIRDMGRDIVRQESPDPEKRSVLWHPEDCISVLREKIGTKTIKALAFDMRMYKKITPVQSTSSANIRKRCASIRDANENIESDAFARMKKLKLLQLNYVKLSGSYKRFPNRLRWLCWHGFHLEAIPSDLSMESLVSLDMQYTKLKKLWKGPKFLPSLKIINLSHSQQLTRTPDFSGAPNLERMILKGCVCLVKICKSIEFIQRLVLLDLEDCRSLRKLPRNISGQRFLESLIISGCSSLGEFPTGLRNMASLKVFCADRIEINAVLARSGEVQHWASLPQSLVELSLSGCSLSDDSFPGDLSNFSNLKLLDLSENLIGSLPDCVKTLSKLKSLVFDNCPKLQSVLGVPRTVIFMHMVGNFSLKRVANIPSLTDIFCYCSENLVEFEGCFKSVPFENADKTIKRNLGLLDLQSRLKGHADVSLFDDLMVNYEYGIFSTVVRGSEIPDWFNYRNKGSSISFTVPSLPNNPPIRGLNVFFVIELQSWTYPLTEISNKTKDLNWIYGSPPPRYCVNGCDLMMLSHWKLGNLLEAGDEVTVSYVDIVIQVKECGVKLVYNEDEEEEEDEEETMEMTLQHDTTYLSWAEQTLTELSQFHDSGTSYYFGNNWIYTEEDITRDWYGVYWDSRYGYKWSKRFSLSTLANWRPDEKYMDHTKKIVAHFGRLPMALQVFGSSLFGKNVGDWVSQLKKLKTIANSHMVQKLEINFDSLQDDVENIGLPRKEASLELKRVRIGMERIETVVMDIKSRRGGCCIGLASSLRDEKIQ